MEAQRPSFPKTNSPREDAVVERARERDAVGTAVVLHFLPFGGLGEVRVVLRVVHDDVDIDLALGPHEWDQGEVHIEARVHQWDEGRLLGARILVVGSVVFLLSHRTRCAQCPRRPRYCSNLLRLDGLSPVVVEGRRFEKVGAMELAFERPEAHVE